MQQQPLIMTLNNNDNNKYNNDRYNNNWCNNDRCNDKYNNDNISWFSFNLRTELIFRFIFVDTKKTNEAKVPEPLFPDASDKTDYF